MSMASSYGERILPYFFHTDFFCFPGNVDFVLQNDAVSAGGQGLIVSNISSSFYSS